MRAMRHVHLRREVKRPHAFRISIMLQTHVLMLAKRGVFAVAKKKNVALSRMLGSWSLLVLCQQLSFPVTGGMFFFYTFSPSNFKRERRIWRVPHSSAQCVYMWRFGCF